MRTIQVELYKLSELSQEAQDKAVESEKLINLHDDWHSYLQEKHKRIGTEAGFGVDKIYFNGFWSQGDGAMFTYKDLDPKLLKEAVHSLFMTREQKDLLSTAYLSGHGKHSGHYYHEHSADHHINLEVDGSEESDKLQSLIDEHYTAVEHYITKLYRSLCQDLYKDLRSTYYELTSREAIIEGIEANDLEFYEHGEPA